MGFHPSWRGVKPAICCSWGLTTAAAYPVITEVDESLQMQYAACLFPAELSVFGPRACLIPNQWWAIEWWRTPGPGKRIWRYSDESRGGRRMYKCSVVPYTFCIPEALKSGRSGRMQGSSSFPTRNNKISITSKWILTFINMIQKAYFNWHCMSIIYTVLVLNPKFVMIFIPTLWVL